MICDTRMLNIKKIKQKYALDNFYRFVVAENKQ